MDDGHIPLELLDLKATPRIEYYGRSRLTFPARPELGGRRVEYVDDEQKAVAICQQFNRPGKPPLFRIAADLLHNKDQDERRALLAGDLEAILGDRLRAIEAKLDIEAGEITYTIPSLPVDEVAVQVDAPAGAAPLDLTPPSLDADGDADDEDDSDPAKPPKASRRRKAAPPTE